MEMFCFDHILTLTSIFYLIVALFACRELLRSTRVDGLPEFPCRIFVSGGVARPDLGAPRAP